MDTITYGQWLKDKRGYRGAANFMSQAALAERVGIDRTHIVQIESGRIGMPDYALRQRIHEVFGTSDDDLRAVGIIRDAIGRVVPTATAIAEAHAPTIQTSEDPVAERLARLRLRYSEEQIVQLMDIVAGIIELSEIPTPSSPERPTRRASGE